MNTLRITIDNKKEYKTDDDFFLVMYKGEELKVISNEVECRIEECTLDSIKEALDRFKGTKGIISITIKTEKKKYNTLNGEKIYE